MDWTSFHVVSFLSTDFWIILVPASSLFPGTSEALRQLNSSFAPCPSPVSRATGIPSKNPKTPQNQRCRSTVTIPNPAGRCLPPPPKAASRLDGHPRLASPNESNETRSMQRVFPKRLSLHISRSMHRRFGLLAIDGRHIPYSVPFVLMFGGGINRISSSTMGPEGVRTSLPPPVFKTQTTTTTVLQGARSETTGRSFAGLKIYTAPCGFLSEKNRGAGMG